MIIWTPGILFNNTQKIYNMSTRCNIHIIDYRTNDNMWLYHHHDGYPNGVGKELTDFLAIPGNRSLPPEGMLDTLIYLYGDEYEVTDGEHGDIDYKYIIDIYEDKCIMTIIEKKDDLDIKIADFKYPQENSGSKKSWKVSDLKKMSASLEYLDKINLNELGICDNVPDDANIDESVLRDKIIEKIQDRLYSDLAIELI